MNGLIIGRGKWRFGPGYAVKAYRVIRGIAALIPWPYIEG